MPSAHQSTGFPCPLPVTISGAIYSGVPQNEVVVYSPATILANPKSMSTR